MKKEFKTAFQYTLGHLGQDKDGKFDNIYCGNNKNRIKFNYNDINRSLPSKEEKNQKKRKI